jgi:hypothetical protein
MTSLSVADEYGLECPVCHSDENLLVAINCMATLTCEGTDPCGDHHWDRQSLCCCHGCGHLGVVTNFEIAGTEVHP